MEHSWPSCPPLQPPLFRLPPTSVPPPRAAWFLPIAGWRKLFRFSLKCDPRQHRHDEAGRDDAAKQVAGQADIVDVVNAVNAAEITLDTVVAVRDKVVAAYQSIMNMPI